MLSFGTICNQEVCHEDFVMAEPRMRPVTRDGGQTLQSEMLLYDELRRTDYGDLVANADALVRP